MFDVNIGVKTLADAQKLIAKQHIEVIENALTQYIKSAIDSITARGEKIEDYALIKVDNPMSFAEDGKTISINSQWRLIHVRELVPEPTAPQED